MSIIDGFFAAAGERYAVAQKKMTEGSGKTDMAKVGGSVFEAVFQYGSGRADKAKDKLIEAGRGSNFGMRYEATARADTIKKWLPLIVGGAVALLVVGGMIKK